MSEIEGRRYEVLRLLGEGGFGRVYQARMRSAGGFSKEVAIKLLTEKDAPDHVLQRFRDESRILGLIRDRAVVAVDPPTRLDGRWAVVMEYVDGVTTAQLMAREPVPPRVALEIVGEVARALDHVYNIPGPGGQPLRLIHRDLKPENLQITPRGDVKVLDFGIARAEFAQREAKTTANIAGTFGYIAPERMEGEELPAGDIYSLGVVLRVLVTGQPPGRRSDFEPDAFEDFHVRRALELASRMCAPEPEDRPIAADLERECAGLVASIPGETLRFWARDHVPAAMEHQDDKLVGHVLTETLSTVKAEIDDQGGITRSTGGRIAVAAAAGTMGVGAIGLVVFVVAAAALGIGFYLAQPATRTEVVEPAVAVAPEVTDPADGAADAGGASGEEPAEVPADAVEGAPAPEAGGTEPAAPAAVPAPAAAPAAAPAPAPAAPAPAVPGPAPAGATFPVTLNSVPMGANVFVDGQLVGQTPLIGFEVAEGEHQVRMELEGSSASRSITVGKRSATKYIWTGGEAWSVRY